MSLLRVLVVDDEPGIRSGISRILNNFTVDYPFMDEHIEFEVIEVASGEEALEVIISQPVDIVLLDNKLPNMQGVEVLEEIRKKQLDLTVVMITSYASLELAVKATRDGAFDFIPKPFTPQELRSSLESITKQLFLKRMTKKLNKEGKTIRFQFLQILSHELKAPLNAIEGYLKIIQEKQLGEYVDNYQQMFNRSLDRIQGMRNLILDLLDFTKIESGKHDREAVNTDIIPVIMTAIDTMKPYSIQKDIKVDLDAPEHIYMKTDADDLEIVFNNLISNAIKYNNNGGSVKCSITESEKEIVINISDTGIGMKDDEISKLFNEFYRIRNERTKNISGSGLGLSIVKKIIDYYRGNISVDSIPDEGTTFMIKLPKL